MHPLRLLTIGLCLVLTSRLMAQSLAEKIREEADQTVEHAVIVEAPPIVISELVEPSGSRAVARAEVAALLESTRELRPVSMLQPTPLLLPSTTLTPQIGLSAATPQVGARLSLTNRLFGPSGVERSPLRAARQGVASLSVDLVEGAQAAPLTSTDLGDLLKKSKTALSVETQTRTPIVNDSRVRSSRVGSLAASGSHWVPARADLDTALSKIDSRVVDDVLVVPGPYSSVYGPGFNFIDFELQPSPRYRSGRETHGMTSFEHKTNGNQWLGQQTISTGSTDWGMRGSYAHRLGSDYEGGDGIPVSSSYESRIFTLAMGRDFSASQSLEASLLRLDQTDVEFPGYVFDITALVTDGYELTYLDRDAWIGERIETELWYNRTEFYGDAGNPAKSRQFPFLTFVDFNGTTDADVMSTGYRRAIAWGDLDDGYQLTLGHDLRMVKQEVNEVFNTLLPANPIRVFGQSPLPRSYSVNPGLFYEYAEAFDCGYRFFSGGRLDFVQTDIVERGTDLENVGLTGRPYEQVVGTDLSQTDRWMGSLYGKLERRHCKGLITSISLGYAERQPTLTELYGVEQLLLLVQNGLNTMTGDPRLKREKLIQCDLTLDYEGENLRGGIRGFGGWAFDYITFENTAVVNFSGEIVQTNLRAVNTRLATLAGFESYLEWLPSQRCSPFATAKYLDGRDRTRNGDFATRPASTFFPSSRVAGLPRGAFSFVSGGDSEPLPGISPFESTLGVRLRDSVDRPQWTLELSARIVDNQDRVATSLLEFPTPGFTLWDIRSIWRPADRSGLTVYAGVENFTDKTYREHLDFQSRAGVSVFQPGANFYVAADLAY